MCSITTSDQEQNQNARNLPESLKGWMNEHLANMSEDAFAAVFAHQAELLETTSAVGLQDVEDLVGLDAQEEIQANQARDKPKQDRSHLRSFFLYVDKVRSSNTATLEQKKIFENVPAIASQDPEEMQRVLYQLYVTNEARLCQQLVSFVSSIRKRLKQSEGQPIPVKTLDHKIRQLNNHLRDEHRKVARSGLVLDKDINLLDRNDAIWCKLSEALYGVAKRKSETQDTEQVTAKRSKSSDQQAQQAQQVKDLSTITSFPTGLLNYVLGILLRQGITNAEALYNMKPGDFVRQVHPNTGELYWEVHVTIPGGSSQRFAIRDTADSAGESHFKTLESFLTKLPHDAPGIFLRPNDNNFWMSRTWYINQLMPKDRFVKLVKVLLNEEPASLDMTELAVPIDPRSMLQQASAVQQQGAAAAAAAPLGGQNLPQLMPLLQSLSPSPSPTAMGSHQQLLFQPLSSNMNLHAHGQLNAFAQGSGMQLLGAQHAQQQQHEQHAQPSTQQQHPAPLLHSMPSPRGQPHMPGLLPALQQQQQQQLQQLPAPAAHPPESSPSTAQAGSDAVTKLVGLFANLPAVGKPQPGQQGGANQMLQYQIATFVSGILDSASRSPAPGGGAQPLTLSFLTNVIEILDGSSYWLKGRVMSLMQPPGSQQPGGSVGAGTAPAPAQQGHPQQPPQQQQQGQHPMSGQAPPAKGLPMAPPDFPSTLSMQSMGGLGAGVPGGMATPSSQLAASTGMAAMPPPARLGPPGQPQEPSSVMDNAMKQVLNSLLQGGANGMLQGIHGHHGGGPPALPNGSMGVAHPLDMSMPPPSGGAPMALSLLPGNMQQMAQAARGPRQEAGDPAAFGGMAAGMVQQPIKPWEAERLTAAARAKRIERYRQKRNERTFRKKIKYQSRKLRADVMPRVKGRFVRKEEREAMERERLAAGEEGSASLDEEDGGSDSDAGDSQGPLALDPPLDLVATLMKGHPAFAQAPFMQHHHAAHQPQMQ